MTFIIVAGICSVVILVYFLRLMADAKKLEDRLRKRSVESSEDVQIGEEQLIELDYPMWTAPTFCKAETVSGGYTVRFYSPDIEESGAGKESGQIPKPAKKKRRVASSRTPSPTNGRRRRAASSKTPSLTNGRRHAS